MSIFIEVGMVYAMDDDNMVEAVVGFTGLGGWVVYDSDELGLMGEGGAGVAALYSCSAWLIVVSGWTLLMGVFIIIEIVRGN